ncbi:MAG: CDP-diacylglycerol--glycerol-3-phosphate 3-phosphatidyltransferase [Gammaproteobacteria bacterium]|nr:CDP-diacylglycerol--glycerol-3-phosphate 3-phosphatidyltransferase [Gammaproteobacteria bacterium]
MNWANIATISRVLLIPVVIYSYNLDTQFSHLLAAILFTVASLTDWLDGYLARKLNQSSEFGAFLDPVADKLLVAVMMIMLVSVYPSLLLAAGVIIAREMLVSALREWMATKGMRDKVAVAFSGKLKTTVQMLAIITLLVANPSLPEWVLMLGYGLIYLAAVLSISSMTQYFRAAWSELQSKS